MYSKYGTVIVKNGKLFYNARTVYIMVYFNEQCKNYTLCPCVVHEAQNTVGNLNIYYKF